MEDGTAQAWKTAQRKHGRRHSASMGMVQWEGDMRMGAPVAEALARVVGVGAPIAFTAYDGSKAGPSDALVTVHVRSVDALRYAVIAPGELGLARAYISGNMEFDGDTYTLLNLLA